MSKDSISNENKEKENSIPCSFPKCFMVKALQANNDQLLLTIEEMQEELRKQIAINEALKQQLANRNRC
jgi:hypothetical protein